MGRDEESQSKNMGTSVIRSFLLWYLLLGPFFVLLAY